LSNACSVGRRACWRRLALDPRYGLSQAPQQRVRHRLSRRVQSSTSLNRSRTASHGLRNGECRASRKPRPYVRVWLTTGSRMEGSSCQSPFQTAKVFSNRGNNSLKHGWPTISDTRNTSIVGRITPSVRLIDSVSVETVKNTVKTETSRAVRNATGSLNSTVAVGWPRVGLSTNCPVSV